MISILDIRQHAASDILDYQQVVSMLGEYSKPRDRISTMLDKGELIRVRKGLYVLGRAFCRRPVVPGQLANLIYGPSYVSLDYALGYYGLIPERIEEITSVTTGKYRIYETPFGVFTYRPLSPPRYVPGVVFGGDECDHHLIATPEKALIDKVWCDKRFKPTRMDDYGAYLFDDLRIDQQQLIGLDPSLLGTIAAAFSSRKIDILVRFIHQVSRSTA